MERGRVGVPLEVCDAPVDEDPVSAELLQIGGLARTESARESSLVVTVTTR